MEQNLNNMDQQLKKKFEQFQPPPPESVWNGVKSGIPVASKGFIAQLYGSKYFLPLAVASVIIIIVAFGFSTLLKKSDINEPELNNIENIISSQTLSEESGIPPGEIAEATSGNTQTTAENKEDQEDYQNNTSVVTSSAPSIKEPLEEPSNIKSDDFFANNLNPDPILINPEIFSTTELSTLTPIKIFNINILRNHSSPKMIRSDQKIVNYGPLLSSKWDLGIFYFREWIYFPEDKEITKYKNSQSFELTGRYHFSEFFIQSGLGIASSEDDGDCRIDYKQYELAGTYEDVYDVTFDSTNQGMVPIFHTQTIEVYDTLYQKMYTPMDHKYTYVQIPLLLGYEQSFAGRFFFNLKLGPVISILIGDNESDIDYPTGHLDIINVHKPLPTRVKTSWQFMLGAGMGYNISNHVALSIEPAFKYYLGSGYKSTDMATTHPYSIGLRGGLIYRF